MAWWVVAAKIVSSLMSAESFSQAEERDDVEGMALAAMSIKSSWAAKPSEIKMEAVGAKAFEYRKPPVGGVKVQPSISKTLGKLGKQAFPEAAGIYDKYKRIKSLWDEEEEED